MYPYVTMLSGSPVTTAWGVLRLRIEETASRYGGQLRIYWISSRGQPTVGGLPAWGLGGRLTNPHCKTPKLLRNVLKSLGPKKGHKTDCSNYRGLSLLSTSYKILSNIPLARLTPHAEEITGDHQCGFRHNRSTSDKIFSIRQILEKNGSIIVQYISYL
jgi:hypothetical protein